MNNYHAYYERDGRWRFACMLGGYSNASDAASHVIKQFPTRAVLLKIWGQHWVCTPDDMTGTLLKTPSTWQPHGEPTGMTFPDRGLTSVADVPSLVRRAQ
jgi:hypothetical protein